MKKLFQASRSFLVARNRKTVLYVALGGMAAVGSLLVSFMGSVGAASTAGDPNTQLVVSRLNQLQTQLESVQESVKKPLPDVDLSEITQQINAVSARLEAVRASNVDELSQTITHTETTLAGKLDSITDVVSHLDQRASPVKFVDLSALPFKVVSIDSIQHIPVASIAYDFKTVPMEKGDALAGWRVVSLDYSKQRMEFQNKQNEHVLVTYEHMG